MGECIHIFRRELRKSLKRDASFHATLVSMVIVLVGAFYVRISTLLRPKLFSRCFNEISKNVLHQ